MFATSGNAAYLVCSRSHSRTCTPTHGLGFMFRRALTTSARHLQRWLSMTMVSNFQIVFVHIAQIHQLLLTVVSTSFAFLTQHGSGHSIAPSSVPSRANIATLKSLGVCAILAFSTVGSLGEEICPGLFALPSQIIDRTKGICPTSFFEGLTCGLRYVAMRSLPQQQTTTPGGPNPKW